MKRPGSSDSLGALMPICPSSDQEHSPGNKHVYSREFESMIEGLDEDGYMEEAGHVPEKKRRLSAVQVKALEKNFEVENKLEPERKLKLAQELGLQPRQVAVWFQNRRARWKTKQLERDYGVLKASYDSLKDNFESLQQQNEALSQQIRELKSKINDETETETDSNLSIKQEEEGAVAMAMEQLPPPEMIEAPVVFLGEGGECKDGPSESDSSAILNEGNSPNAATAAAQQTSLLGFNYCATSSSSIGYLNLLEASACDALAPSLQYVKTEEHDSFGEDACIFYSEEQAPTLHWWTQNFNPGEIPKLV